MSGQPPNSPNVSLLDEEGICMLSLDGGGVRGLSSLYVLKRIMDGLNAERKRSGQSPQKPADIFDLIGGTSTGGLIAIMLGRLQMDVDECISAYTDLTKVARFDSGGLKAAIEKTLMDRGFSPTDSMVDSREPDCKVFVCATSKLDAATYRFRSYTSQKSSLSATICQAARATSAATTFFNPVSIEGMKFVDGALGANNPVDQVEEEAMEIWCPSSGNLQPLVKCFISIGTGKLPAYNIDDRVDKLIGALAKMATDAEKIAEASTKRWRQHFEQGRYFRFNVEHGLQNVGMKEYRKRREIQAATDKYLDSQVQSFWVQRCVENLILKKKSTRLGFELLIAPQQDFGSSSPSPQSTEKSRKSRPKQPTSGDTKSPPQPCFYVPIKLSKPSIDRSNYLKKLQAAFSQDCHQIAALAGPGGSGKTQIAAQFAEWLHTTCPEYSVFWISGDNLQQSYSGIAQKLGLFRRYQRELKSTDARVLFHRYISAERFGRWFLIIDDADANGDLLSPDARPGSVFNDLPQGKEGSILFITHSMKAASAAVKEQANQVIKVEGLDGPDAMTILGHSLFNKRLLDDESKVRELLSELNGLPLSIKQAARYLNNCAHLTIDKFLDLLRSPSQDAFLFILQESDGRVQGSDSHDSILESVVKSFEAVRKENPHAGKLLEFISQIASSSIPRTILPGTTVKEGKSSLEQSIGTLCSSFLLVPRQGGIMFDMPTIVHLCTRVWVQQKKASKGLTEIVTKRLNELVPPVDWSKRLIWKKYEAHAIRVLTTCQDLNLRFDERFQLLCITHFDTLKIQVYLIEQYLKIKELTKAISLLEELVPIQRKTLGQVHKRTMSSENDLAELYLQNRNVYTALKLYEHMVSVRQKNLGPGDEQRKWAEARYEKCIKTWKWTWARR
ncbi:Calcium-independent phospholipase A2-gamma [Fusarium odoratissimum]|uniref:Calcium-independent phospholipase A2-gamma n=1 Tax=Fusarium oxysporum f. sp. cubense (strain race 4) TaxID=2502994 RepID=N1S8V1_FUSC4|nr:Calcium-independent phospholipase A2-gamma [Fusarium odoratissimum]